MSGLDGLMEVEVDSLGVRCHNGVVIGGSGWRPDSGSWGTGFCRIRMLPVSDFRYTRVSSRVGLDSCIGVWSVSQIARLDIL